MKKSLLTIALLGSIFQLKAQLTTVTPGAVMTVRPGTLVYNGGGFKTVGDGKVDNYGNFMIVGAASGTADTFETVTSSGAKKYDGGNFNLLYVDATPTATSQYGQLYITNLRQADITGVVNKQYIATKNGSFQQMGIPFYNKKLSGTSSDVSTLAADLGVSAFSNLRNTNSVGYWENQRVLMHNLPGTASTLDKASADIQTVVNNNAARYYAVGTEFWNPSTAVHTIKGVPFSDLNTAATSFNSSVDGNMLTYTLRGAGYTLSGTPISYGVGTGNNNNGVYNEQYKTYLQDAFGIANGQGFYNSTAGSEAGTFGRNLYQFSNPFLTNIDVNNIGYDEDGSGTGDDKNNISNIYGIRYESVGVTTGNLGGTSSTSFKFITYNDTTGIPAGDYDGAIIKPMQAFVIKLRNNDTNQSLIFNTLRRFSFTKRAASTPYSVTAAKNSTSQKQLRVIGLNSAGDEVMRTYYVVGANLSTGRFNDVKLQASAFSGALSTREELLGGGEDTVASSLYWLYINEANEVDNLGKKIRMVTNLNSISSYKFELAENAEALADGASTFSNGGKSFYIEQTPGVYTQISHNLIIPATTSDSGLYYGTPNSGNLGTSEVSKADELVIAHDITTNTKKVIFPKSWNKAAINIYDMAGRKLFSGKDIETREHYVLPISNNAAYIVECISDKGVKVVKKVLN